MRSTSISFLALCGALALGPRSLFGQAAPPANPDPELATASLRTAIGTRVDTAVEESSLVEVRAAIHGVDVVRTARQFLGVRYRLGGTTPKAFDCSGYVRYVFAQHGITLPRTAREQVAVGDAPFPGDLEPGDLLFFYGGQGAQHIAIYVGGDTIIHASSSGRRVKLDRMGGTRNGATWFGRRLIAVRRVLPMEGVLRMPTTTTAAHTAERDASLHP